MRTPEDLIGRKSNTNNNESDSYDNNSNCNNDNSGAGTAYTIRYSSVDFLAEAVLIAGQPKFLVVERNSGSISIKSSINVEGKNLKPLKKETYLSKAYSFSSEREIFEYGNEARKITLSDLYTNVKSHCKLFIVGNVNHITLLSADITYTYNQDRLGLTHYLFFIGKPGSGKSNNLTLIKLLGYRTFMSTDMTSANIYQFLGSQEEAMGTLCIDEANTIDENNKLMEICKTGYVKGGGKVVLTDIHNGRIQNAYYTFCYKAFAGERLPDGITANGFNERTVPINCYDGNPKYDIAEIVSPAGEQEYQQLLDQIEHTRNLLFIHRLVHWFEPIPNPTIKLKRREKQLFISLIRMYHGEGIWPEIKSAISHFIFERRGRQMDTLHAYLYGLIKRLVKNNNSTELKSSNIWRELKNELAGNEIPNKPLSYYTERFGLISQTQITKILTEIFGAIKPRNHGDANRLVFNNEILERLKMTYEVSIDSAKVRIDGDDGDDSRYGMDVFVEDNHGTTSSNVNMTSENLGDNNDPNGNPNETAKLEDNHIDGDIRIDGIDNSEDENNDNKICLDGQTDSDTCHLSSHNDDIHIENAETDQSLTNTNNQMRKAITGASTYTHTNNLSHHPHISQPTKEKIAEFFNDDLELPYHPPPPHNLDESPCKSIIRVDNHFLYYCTLHPDIRSYHLDSIEHHIKYKNAELHKSEILKLLDIYNSVHQQVK